MQRFGLDFGTTNSSLSWARGAADVQLCALDLRAPVREVLRSLLYYSTEARGFVVGQRAIDEYLREDMQGVLMQSIKTFLADDSFEETWVHGRPYRLEDLIAVVFQHVRAAVRALAGEDEVRLVIGRPAVFAERPEKERVAQQRLARAAQLAAFYDVRFLYEPIAAGLAYEASLEEPELALIADFGGGTSDFTVMRLGSRATGDRREDILASGGVQVGGDTFDARIMARKLAPHFGAGTTYRSMHGRDLPFPKHLLAQLGQWHHVGLLRGSKARDLLGRIRWTSSRPESVDAFETLIESNFIFFLFQEIERAKSRLSDTEEARISFHRANIDIEERLTRAEFEELIEADRAEVHGCMRAVIAAAGVHPKDVQSVFLTGGSAQIPAIRRMFVEEFGEERLRSQDYLTTVSLGLARAAYWDRGQPD